MHDRGAASVEWIALLAVVVVALGAAVAGAVPHAPFLPRAVGATFERALCLVGGGDCLGGAPRPCVVRTHERATERRATLAVVRLGDGRTVLREERSDGTVVVSVEDAARAGGAVSLGAELTVGGQGVKASAELGGHARGARGRRFVVAGTAAADRLVERLAGEHSGARRMVGGGDHGLVSDERWWSFGPGGGAEAALRLKGLGSEARVDGSTVAGVRERTRTGERTVVLRNDSELVAALSAPLARLSGAVPAHAGVELAFDRHGNPASLTVRAVRGVHGEVRVGSWRSGGGDLVEVEARLDLADPVTRSLAGSLLSPRRAPGAARALAARLADRARIDARLYDTDRRESVKGFTGGFLVKAGYEVVSVVRTGRLVDAGGREPGMGWARRLDCVGVA